MIVGKHTYGAEKMYVEGEGQGTELIIGSFCSIASDVEIMLWADHRTDAISTFPFGILWQMGTRNTYSKGDVKIGNDVWIGRGATIMSGVTIGHGAVIGAKAVVAKDVPPYAVVVGNPGKIVKYRFSKEKIKRLLKLKWWDWPDEKIRDNIDWMTK
jgi:chloramphenicol O-acetyltransferase type B